VFDDLYFVQLVVVGLVLCYPSFTDCLWFFLPTLILISSLPVKRLAGKSISDMTCLVSRETLNINSVSQLQQLAFHAQ